MKKYIALAITILTLLLAGCQGGDITPITGDFTLKAIVKNVDNIQSIEVEVIESDYAYGIYVVHTGNATFINAEGQPLDPSEIAVGDTLQISYSGQVMMSYPPQIVALKIQKL